MAKKHASCADVAFYQFVTHLGNGHLATEPIALGLHNHFRCGFKKNHPLGDILFPPVEGLIGINHFAGMSLIDANTALTENTFSIGTIKGVDLFARYLKDEYSFDDLAADTDLVNRGFLDPARVTKNKPFDIEAEIKLGNKSTLIK